MPNIANIPRTAPRTVPTTNFDALRTLFSTCVATLKVNRNQLPSDEEIEKDFRACLVHPRPEDRKAAVDRLLERYRGTKRSSFDAEQPTPTLVKAARSSGHHAVNFSAEDCKLGQVIAEAMAPFTER
jgi:hypothetical protein